MMSNLESKDLEQLVNDLSKEWIVVKIEDARKDLKELIALSTDSWACSQWSCSWWSWRRDVKDLLEEWYRKAA